MKFYKISLMSGLLCLLAIAIGTLWLWISARPVIWAFREKGMPSEQPNFSIFNPFRQKGPEIEADQILNNLKNGGCEMVVRSLRDPKKHEDVCERETLDKLEEWKLTNREDSDDIFTLYYRVRRTSPEFTGEMLLTVEQGTNGQWKVTDMNAIY